MADRFFPNEMPEFVPEATVDESSTKGGEDSLLKLLSLPNNALSHIFKQSALDLKQLVLTNSSDLNLFLSCDFFSSLIYEPKASSSSS